MNERRWLVACAVVALSACGDNGGGGTDSGVADSGGGGSDAGALMLPRAMADTDGNAENGTEAPANFACLGTPTAPTAGAAIDFTANFYSFGATDPVPDAPVQIFTTNVVGPTCAAPDCATYTTDASGNATITAPASAWLAYRVPATGDFVDTIGYNRDAPAAATDTLDLPVVSMMTLGFIPALFFRTRVPGTGVVSGNLSDCDGNTVEGAQLHLFRGGTEIQPGSGMTDFFVGYFNAATGLPSRTAKWTDADGIYASANVEATTDLVRVEVWAVLTEGGEPERVACEAIQVAADAVSIISAGPTRGDYPAGHPCAM